MSFAVLGDPNADLLRQLTRIANALDKANPSPWIDWGKTLASFILGIVTAYLGLRFQGSYNDRNEQKKMRRIVYTELIQAFLLLDSSVRAKAFVPGPGVRYQIFQDLCTFDGEAYINGNPAVFYGLPEGTDITWIYKWFHKIGAGGTYGAVEMRGPLAFFCERFCENRVVRSNVKRFASAQELHIIEEGAKIYSRSVTLEDMVDSGLIKLVPRKTAESDINQPDLQKGSAGIP